MNPLQTDYLGMPLRTPLVVSASPLTRDLESVMRAEEAGASGVVLESVFEEDITHQQYKFHRARIYDSGPLADEKKLFPKGEPRTPEEHLRGVENICSAVDFPVIVSLNATSPGPWLEYASSLAGTGANALELNIYFVAASAAEDGREVEKRHLDIVREVSKVCTIPISVKMSPFFSSIRDMTSRLVDAGANGLVLFNRFYQPDINLETMEVLPHLLLSNSWESRLALRWVAILRGRIGASLAATTGIHTSEDALRMTAAGADVTMLCSILLREGLSTIGRIESEMKRWLESHEYSSLTELRGLVSQDRYTDPEVFERANYVRALRSYM